MFPTFIGILDIQSWWEVPSIAHFCSLFRAAFNLLDFDIEDLEEALLTDGGTEGRLLQELIVRLLEGCLPNESRNDISTFNYQMFLRRLFRKKCQDYKYENPFNTDVDFELLPLRQKVEILRSLCDFRLDAEDVELALSNLDSDSLRVEPLGHDRSNSAYWYFYGTRLYREDYISPNKALSPRQNRRARDKRRKKRRVRGEKVVEKEEEEENEVDHLISDSLHDSRTTVWQVVCFTQQDWSRLVDKFKDSEYDTERKLYHTLSEDFLPEIPKLFELKEKQQRRRLLERNTRVQRGQEPAEPTEEAIMVRAKMKTKAKATRRTQATKNGDSEDEAPPPAPPQKKGRQTNNSLASADGQIVIHTRDELDGAPKKGVPKHTSTYVSSYPYTFGIEEEERRVGMHKVLESLKDHVDAWPFVDPVDEEYAPRYYSVVRKPMDLSTMEEKLEGGSYKNLSQFKRDFRLIVDNCRQYNGSDNEYTEMAVNLKEAFDRAVDRYLESEPSSDECPSVPASPNAVPSSPYPARASSSPSLLSSTRKRNKKSKQKSKSNKSEKKSKGRGRDEEEEDEHEEEGEEEEESPRDKRGKKRSKRAREEEERNEDNDEDDENGAISESSVIKSKRKKYSEVERLLPKSKKLSAKEEKSEESNKRGKNRQKEQVTKNTKEHRESRRKKEDFEEDHEPLINIKSKSKRIEKRGIEDNAGLTDRIRKKQKKPEKIVEESDDERLSEIEENGKQTPEKKKNRSKRDKTGQKPPKIEVKHERKASKEKDKKSKVKKMEERPKNGEVKKLEKEKDTKKEDTASKKFDSLVSNKDLESLDSLKDRISERRREDKLKQERERAKRSAKIDTEKKKVPSNGNTYHESGKVNLKRAKLKKPVKDDKVLPMKDETVEIKKPKLTHGKHGKNREESPAIQALNQATEQTLNDINKWLDDAPKLSEFSSGSDSPVTKQPSTSETSSRGGKPEPLVRKRPTSVKFLGPNGPPRPKKVQRTIDRLQPGKAKGNLLLKKPLPSGSNSADTSTSQSTSDVDHPSKDSTDEPKLSLGTVLKNSDSIQLMCKSLVSSPNPNLSNEDDEDDRPAVTTSKKNDDDKSKEMKDVAPKADPEQMKSTQEESQKPKSATPNLSAWFKAFGAPKSKKKEEEIEEPVKKEEFQEIPQRQRRLSAGGSSVSESVSSFSQESPPGLTIRSPQSQPALTPTAIEQPIRAGFYQDALSTGSSPNNSPYYATPPRYSAQLPPTPSPQNYSHPLSPAYPSSAAYDQNPLYPQLPQASHQVYQKPVTPENPPEAYPTYPQNSPQPDNYINSPQQLPTNQKQSPVYPQPSPQALPVYPQNSPQPPPSNYSQPSPQQPTTPNYSQPSPQQPTANYSQPSPQNPTYSQPSPQSLNYSQPSPQQPPKYSQPSPQAPNYSQHSPQQPNASSTGYSAQVSPQPARIYPQPSPQPCPLPVRPPANYSQASPRAPAQSTPQTYQKPEEYAAGGSYPQGFKSNHSPYVPPVSAAPVEAERRVEYLKPEEKLPVQQMETPRNFTSDPPLGLNPNHQVYQSNQFPPAYGNNYSATGDPQRPGSRLNPQETPQQPQDRHFDPETLKYQRQDQSQLLSFQQNLPGHDTIYQPAGGFQAPPYPMPNPSCRPVYPSPHYYDASAKSSSSSVPSSGASTLTPVKKRMYNEPTSDSTRALPEQQPRGTQEQFGYDQMMTLATSEPGQNLVSGQFESGFGSLDSVAGNSAYARLGLGLVGRSSKDQQQLLSIPRPSSKDALSYRQPGASDLDLNLLQSLQNAAAKTIPATHSRREPAPAPAPTKGRKSKKKAQAQAQQQATITEQQMPGFSQYSGNPGDPIGLKNAPAIPPGGSAFNFATPAGGTNSSPFYDKDASAAAAAFAFLDEFRNPNSYYSILRQQQGQPQATPVTEAGQQANKLNNQPPRNYPPHPFLHSPQRSAPYGPPVSAYVSPHGPNLGVDPAAYQQYIHSLYALQPPSHHHRPSWL
ncbi:bromodomain-containing protein 4 [Diachasma alloeum]|uniref:bromodomain-containing protein 4 n=1 Tax=Diachasma alloeum TaxID=454923 RepID=UPI00073814CF|nr:bromodomain-containing protein 4 [Diachasma alloeum]